MPEPSPIVAIAGDGLQRVVGHACFARTSWPLEGSAGDEQDDSEGSDDCAGYEKRNVAGAVP
jgi:hypothetical protein